MASSRLIRIARRLAELREEARTASAADLGRIEHERAGLNAEIRALQPADFADTRLAELARKPEPRRRAYGWLQGLLGCFVFIWVGALLAVRG